MSSSIRMRPKMKLFISRIAHTKPALGIYESMAGKFKELRNSFYVQTMGKPKLLLPLYFSFGTQFTCHLHDSISLFARFCIHLSVMTSTIFNAMHGVEPYK